VTSRATTGKASSPKRSPRIETPAEARSHPSRCRPAVSTNATVAATSTTHRPKSLQPRRRTGNEPRQRELLPGVRDLRCASVALGPHHGGHANRRLCVGRSPRSAARDGTFGAGLRSVSFPGRYDPLGALAGDLGDQVEVAVVVEHRQVEGLRVVPYEGAPPRDPNLSAQGPRRLRVVSVGGGLSCA